MKLDSLNVEITLPMLSRIFQRQSRFRRAIAYLFSLMLCSVVTFLSMTLLTGAAFRFYLEIGQWFEEITPSQFLVLPFSLLFSTFVGSMLGSQLGLSRSIRSLAVVIGLLVFYCMSLVDWSSLFISDSTLDWFSGSMCYSTALESGCEAILGNHTSAAFLQTALVGLWISMGLAAGMVIPTSQKVRPVKAFVCVIGIFVLAVLLLASILIPMAIVEMGT